MPLPITVVADLCDLKLSTKSFALSIILGKSQLRILPLEDNFPPKRLLLSSSPPL